MDDIADNDDTQETRNLGSLAVDLEPYYADDGVIIYFADSSKYIEQIAESGALVWADPPYGVNERTRRRSSGRSGLALCNDFPPVLGDDQPFDPAPWLACERLVLWGANHYASRLPDSPTWLAWDKRDQQLENDNADCELAWTNLGGPARVFRHLWAGMLRASEQDEPRVHPTQKPIALARWAFERWCEPSDLVVDPFMGSGSALLAARECGQRAIGFELSEEYCRLAVERLGRARTLGMPSYPTEKRCPQCKRWLRVEVNRSFNAKARTGDGLQPWCRECDTRNKYGEHNGWKNFRRALETRGKGEERLWTKQLYHDMMRRFSTPGDDRFRCRWCTQPVSEYGGTYWVDRIDNDMGYLPHNCQPACKPCNFMKSNSHPAEWEKQLEGLMVRHRGNIVWSAVSPKWTHISKSIPNLESYVVRSEQNEMLFTGPSRRAS
jgi:site-specific DNA-methyltransferase (adenine-specific)